MNKQSHITEGLAFLLNNPKTNPLTNEGKKVYDELFKASGMPVSKTLEYIGKKTKTPRITDEQKSKERLNKLEEQSEK